MKIIKPYRWIISISIFGLLLLSWIGLAAATSLKTEAGLKIANTAPGFFSPENSTFSITIGAIVLLSIIISSAIFHPKESS